MQRTRDMEKWAYEYHESCKDFLAASRTSGVHSIHHRGQQLDLLVIDRKSPVTLITFHGAIPKSVANYPRFDGQAISKNAATNLIAVSDPSIALGISLGWHLGNDKSGPLRPILTPLIHHILESLGSTRTILLGGSGGGFAAAQYAQGFPGSVAFLFNPRLSLNRLPRTSIRTYLSVCHSRGGTQNVPTGSERTYLEPYGLTDIAELATRPIDHHLLIYQNLLDRDFLQTQFLPFISNAKVTDKIRIRLSHDGEGHVYIPRENIRQIIKALSSDAPLEEAIVAAGFAQPLEALTGALHIYPEIYATLTSAQQLMADIP